MCAQVNMIQPSFLKVIPAACHPHPNSLRAFAALVLLAAAPSRVNPYQIHNSLQCALKGVMPPDEERCRGTSHCRYNSQPVPGPLFPECMFGLDLSRTLLLPPYLQYYIIFFKFIVPSTSLSSKDRVRYQPWSTSTNEHTSDLDPCQLQSDPSAQSSLYFPYYSR